MKVLCIETSIPPSNANHPPVIKGEIYEVVCTRSWNIIFRGVDIWHTLKDRSYDAYHISLFIDLPNDVTFSKKEEETLITNQIWNTTKTILLRNLKIFLRMK